MVFIPYADPAKATSTVAPSQWQYDSVAPFQNNASGYGQAAVTPGYQSAVANYGSGGGNYQDPTAAAQAAQDAQYTAQLNGQLGRLDSQQNVGLDNLNRSYDQNLNSLNYSRDLAQRDYNLGKQDTEQGYQTTRNNVATQTRSRMNALQRLIGMAGSGNSSAAEESAPAAALREGSIDLNGAQQTYATNRRKQDINWGDTQTDYQGKTRAAADDRANRENSLLASIAQTRAGILDKLGQVGNNRDQYANQINGLLDQITNYGRQAINTTAPVAYQAPSLAQYDLNAHRSNVQIAPEQQALADSVNPTLLPLLAQREQDQYGGLLA